MATRKNSAFFKQPYLKLVMKSLAGLIIAGSFAIWVYGLLGFAASERIDLRTGEPRRDAADLFDDSTLSMQAETICDQAQQAIGVISVARSAKSSEERSQQIVDSTKKLETMITELAALETATERDAQIKQGWLQDWQVIVNDRYSYADAVVTNPSAQYLRTDTDSKEPIDKRINRLAGTNNMLSCIHPEDL